MSDDDRQKSDKYDTANNFECDDQRAVGNMLAPKLYTFWYDALDLLAAGLEYFSGTTCSFDCLLTCVLACRFA